MAASTDFRLITDGAFASGVGTSNLSTSQFGLGGGQIFTLISSNESSDFQGITGFFTGIGSPPSGGTISRSGGGNAVGIYPGDLVMHIASTLAARPGRVTLHACLRSTADFSTGTNNYSSTGGYDITLSNSCTA